MTMQQPLQSQFHMSQRAIDAFGALIGKRVPSLKRKPGTGHHSDPDAAKSVGLRGPVGFSLHYYAHVSHLMTQRFGRRWTEGGEMSIAFIKPVCAGDDITVRIGERPLQRPEPVAEGRIALQADVFNQLGELVAAGAVSVATA
jgi:acyl dehydratase